MIAARNLPVKAGMVIGLADRIYYSSDPAGHLKALDVIIRNATYSQSSNTFTGMALPGSPDMVLTLYKISISSKSIFCTCPNYNLRLRPRNNRSETHRYCKHIIALSTKILTSFGELK